MTPEQVHLVETSFAKVKPIAEQAGALFYGRLFELRPDFRPLFKKNLQEQERLLMATLATAVAALRRPAQLERAIENLGARHAGYGVRPEYFEPVGEALLWTLEKGLGADFTPDVKAAWVALYGAVTDMMVRGLQRVQAAAAKTAALAAARQAPPPRATWLGRLAGWFRAR